MTMAIIIFSHHRHQKHHDKSNPTTNDKSPRWNKIPLHPEPSVNRAHASQDPLHQGSARSRPSALAKPARCLCFPSIKHMSYIYIYTYVCMYACMHACMYVCMYVYTHSIQCTSFVHMSYVLRRHTHACVCTYIYIYIERVREKQMYLFIYLFIYSTDRYISIYIYIIFVCVGCSKRSPML